jgi:hypothetical protein
MNTAQQSEAIINVLPDSKLLAFRTTPTGSNM